MQTHRNTHRFSPCKTQQCCPVNTAVDLRIVEDRPGLHCRTGLQNETHYAHLESADAVVGEDCQKEGRHSQVQESRNLEEVHIVQMVLLDDHRRYLGVGFLHKEVVGCLKAHHKMAANFGALHKMVGCLEVRRRMAVAEIDGLHRYLGAANLHKVAAGSVVLRMKFVVSYMTGIEIDSGNGKTVAEADYTSYELCHLVDRTSVVLNLCSHLVDLHETNIHSHLLPAFRCQLLHSSSVARSHTEVL